MRKKAWLPKHEPPCEAANARVYYWQRSGGADEVDSLAHFQFMSLDKSATRLTCNVMGEQVPTGLEQALKSGSSLVYHKLLEIRLKKAFTVISDLDIYSRPQNRTIFSCLTLSFLTRDPLKNILTRTK